MKQLVDRFERALLTLDRLAIAKLFAEGSEMSGPLEVVENLVVPSLERIGSAWEEGRVALAQVYMSGRVCEELVDDILPATSPARTRQPKTAIAVLEDHHLLGKRIVYSLLRASGFEVLDFGQIGVDDLVHRVEEEEVRILLISTLMLPSALRVEEVRTRLDGEDVKIIVGGAPFRFDERLWREVGADAVGHSASDAPGLVTRIVEAMS
ncbi:MAG: cobalamin-binding protein [bacterium]|nr:cobalamin-binding protein [bacterium]